MAVITSNNRFVVVGQCSGGDMWTSGLEYNGSAISGYSGSAFYQAPQTELSAGDKISVTETGNTAVISVTGLPSVDVEAPLYIVSDTTTGKTIGFSGDLTPDIDVINSTPGFVSGHCESGKLTLSGKDWGNDITGASANAASVGSGAAVSWVTDQGYITAQKEYAGVSPIVVNNTGNKISADTAVLTAQSPIYIETTTSGGVEVNTIKFSGDTGNTFTASMAANTVNYSGASAMRANFHNYGGRTAATSWGYFNSISLYPVGGSTSYGSTTFTLPDEFGYEGLIYRNGNQYKYLPVPFWSSYTSGTSGLSFYGDSAWDARYIYFYSLDQEYGKFSLTVPKHSRIEISYNAAASTRGYSYSTPANLFLTNTTSTADGTAYNLDMSPLVWPTADDQFNFHADFSWHNTGNYDTDVYIRMDTRAMGNAWNPTGYYYIGGPNNEKLTYRIYPDLV